MKMAILNFSGNVGKTTLAANLLKPRMPNAPVYAIESINSDEGSNGISVEKMRGRHYGELQEHLMTLEAAIVDVGASNVEEFLKLMQQYHGSHEEFDYFIVPVVKEKKQMADTVNTIRALSSIGVPRQKIRIVFNMVEMDDVIEDEFAPLFGLAELEKSFTLNPRAVVYANEVFDKLREIGKSLADVDTDATDYRARLRESHGDEETEFYIKMVAIKRLAVTAIKNLDAAFKEAFE
ncbi:plasmid stabilization protein [Massilia sp. NEAU-DD11]|uniref:Plasmid stabilization protein n=1 Tax=Massilia cellulosiltytica TaxID=2683234 RepID=A0A7X3KBV1_9BURK|nr:StbB family protein [Telluria cellulosilytica]MVW64456.1 plasmid stabilization protein [Telluria cellulosilytica]